ncbi:unnamed protein product [Toxocara canis]|uniref:Ovule protein n=1 Tax=Toxocara canis TaxID=6265 RepID=A0A183TV41_TOXCA|nr:unnamed protein product [Toxocara canis]
MQLSKHEVTNSTEHYVSWTAIFTQQEERRQEEIQKRMGLWGSGANVRKQKILKLHGIGGSWWQPVQKLDS